jgi:hypothetical protein
MTRLGYLRAPTSTIARNMPTLSATALATNVDQVPAAAAVLVAA